MKRRTFVGSLGAGTLSGLDLLQRALAAEAPQNSSVSPATRTDNEREFKVLHGQRIILNGDSISKGYAFGNYTDPSPLRTLYGMARILMADNLERPPEWIWIPGI